MLNITNDLKTGEWKVALFDVNEVITLVSKVFKSADTYLDYSVPHAANAYENNQLQWVYKTGIQGSQTPLAYELVYNYRNSNHSSDNWGMCTIARNFGFPAALTEHRKAMIERMKKEGRIKGDSRCPRIAGFKINKNGSLMFQIEIASYHDQVGTNLTIDYPLKKFFTVEGKACSTVREWDCIQAGLKGKGLPIFEESRLANTIGVGIGLSAKASNGIKHYIYRFRTHKAPVYPGTWHLPVSFALEIDESVTVGQKYDIATLIRMDMPEELIAEAELLRRDFGPLRPIAFCRDLSRGGKPQFFCELESKLSLEKLLTKIGSSSKEYRKTPKTIPDGQIYDIPVSPELACFFALKSNMPKA